MVLSGKKVAQLRVKAGDAKEDWLKDRKNKRLRQLSTEARYTWIEQQSLRTAHRLFSKLDDVKSAIVQFGSLKPDDIIPSFGNERRVNVIFDEKDGGIFVLLVPLNELRIIAENWLTGGGNLPIPKEIDQTFKTYSAYDAQLTAWKNKFDETDLLKLIWDKIE